MTEAGCALVAPAADPVPVRCTLVVGGVTVSRPVARSAEAARATSLAWLPVRPGAAMLSDDAVMTPAAAAVVTAVAVITRATDAAAAVLTPPPSHDESRSGALVSSIHRLSGRRPE